MREGGGGGVRGSPVLQFVEESLQSERNTFSLIITLCRHLVHSLGTRHINWALKLIFYCTKKLHITHTRLGECKHENKKLGQLCTNRFSD